MSDGLGLLPPRHDDGHSDLATESLSLFRSPTISALRDATHSKF